MGGRIYKARQDKNERIRGGQGHWGNLKESPGKEIEVACECDANIGVLSGKEGDGKGSTREIEERKA